MDSFEVEEFRKLIKKKEEYLEKVENDKAAQYLQGEILFLKNKILPILMMETMINHQEIAKYAVQCFDDLLNSGKAERYNGMLLYIHFNDEHPKHPMLSMVAEFSTIQNFKSSLEIKDTVGITEKI